MSRAGIEVALAVNEEGECDQLSFFSILKEFSRQLVTQVGQGQAIPLCALVGASYL